jgi:hypothetical protein
MRRNDYFLSVPGDPRRGLIVNCPAALRGGGVHALPPYAPLRASRVDCYPACPADWPRSTRSASSRFVAIVEGRGMWLDFDRRRGHPHHVAVVVSIQGVNPLTGRKADRLELEAYPDDGAALSLNPGVSAGAEVPNYVMLDLAGRRMARWHEGGQLAGALRLTDAPDWPAEPRPAARNGRRRLEGAGKSHRRSGIASGWTRQRCSSDCASHRVVAAAISGVSP